MFKAQNNIETRETTENYLTGPQVTTTYDLDVTIRFSEHVSIEGLAYDAHKRISRAMPKIQKILEECMLVDND